jgi:hypothetical protein
MPMYLKYSTGKEIEVQESSRSLDGSDADVDGCGSASECGSTKLSAMEKKSDNAFSFRGKISCIKS